MLRVDTLDKKILIALLKDGRLDFSILGRMVGASKEKVRYRVNRLVSLGIISDFKLIINYKKLGYEEYNLFFKLNELNSQIKEKIKDKLKNNPNTIWVGDCLGDYDFRVYLISKNFDNLKKVFIDLDRELGKNFKEYNLLRRERKYNSNNFLMFNYMSDVNETNELKKTAEKIKNFTDKKKIMPDLDEKDWKIAYYLAKNTRASYVEIANGAKLKVEDVKYRMKKIKGINSPIRFSISLDYTKFDLIWWGLLLRTANKEVDKDLVEYIINHPQTVNVIENVGSDWDFDITFYSRNIEDANKYLMELRNKFFGAILNHKLLIVNDSFKSPQLSEAFFKDMMQKRKDNIAKNC